jgi:hypothetical protein
MPGVILYGSDQGNAGFLKHRLRRFEAVALVRLEIGDVLHAGLNPLRHEESLLFGGLQIVEHFPHAAPVPVKTQRVANAALGLRSINWHRSRPEFHLEKRPGFFLSSGSPWFRAGCRFRTRVCHHFVTTLVHGVAGVVNRSG